MYIISPFRDYYDSCAVYGIDKSIRFLRHQREIERIDKPEHKEDFALCSDITRALSRVKGRMAYLDNDFVQHVFIGFCAKLYLCLRIEIDASTDKMRIGARDFRESAADRVAKGVSRFEYAWSTKDVCEHDLLLKVSPYFYPFRAEKAKSISDWFENNAEVLVTEALPLFVDHKLVSFVVDGKKLIINPALQDYRFQRAMDGVTAFQEVAMFISGVLPDAGNPTVEVSDKDRVYAHGFDDKSFRKEPAASGRKARRRVAGR